MAEGHVWPLESTTRDDRLRLAAIVETPRVPRREIWFDVPIEYAGWVTDRADPFYLVARRWMMFEGIDAIVHGPVATTLRAKDGEFQRNLMSLLGLHPEREIPYRQVTLDATEVVETPAAEPEAAVAAFSGGLDSLFTIYQNVVEPQPGAWDIRAAVMVHGFDIALDDPKAWSAAVDRAGPALAEAGLPLIEIATNARELGDWLVLASSGLTAALALFGGAVGRGVVAGSDPYFRDGRYTLGVSDTLYPWLSSRSFEVVVDARSFDRPGKIRGMGRWTTALERMRVCYAPDANGVNCGVCKKCVGTWLHCRSLGVTTGAFSREPDPDTVAAKLREWDPNHPVWGPAYRHGLEQWVVWAEADGIDEPWLAVARGLLQGQPSQ